MNNHHVIGFVLNNLGQLAFIKNSDSQFPTGWTIGSESLEGAARRIIIEATDLSELILIKKLGTFSNVHTHEPFESINNDEINTHAYLFHSEADLSEIIDDERFAWVTIANAIEQIRDQAISEFILSVIDELCI